MDFIYKGWTIWAKELTANQRIFFYWGPVTLTKHFFWAFCKFSNVHTSASALSNNSLSRLPVKGYIAWASRILRWKQRIKKIYYIYNYYSYFKILKTKTNFIDCSWGITISKDTNETDLFKCQSNKTKIVPENKNRSGLYMSQK